jgi:DNA polymerase-3 subunit alpha
MPSREFVHLHVHSEYSLLNATCRIKDLVAKAAETGMKAVALTDMGNLFAAIEFYYQCQQKKIKPILGCDIYVAPVSRFDHSKQGLPFASHPLVLLCENDTGYKNLIKLVSAGYLEGFYYKPRVDKELLRAHHEGLIALSGSLLSELPHLINIGQAQKAREAARGYLEIFGKDNFFIELIDSKLRDQDKVNAELRNIAAELGIGLVAANNVLYTNRKDAHALEAAMCIQDRKTFQDEDRFRIHTTENFFKSPSEMWSSFEDLPEACENTVKIADRCNVTIDFKTLHLPFFATPGKLTAAEYLKQLTYEGSERRYGTPLKPEIKDRIDYELGVIDKLGYGSYFLIVWDFVRFAREKGIPVGPGRGSAAGSVISYCLGITNIDPLKYNLLFERFLNPDRVTMPDIDIDFCYNRREEVIQYVTEKYSKDNVSQIITFGTMLAKGVLRDVGRVLGLPYADVDKIAKLVPAELNITLEQALEKEPLLKDLSKSTPQNVQLFELARALEGLPRHAGLHAAGVVISKEPLIENTPLFKSADDQISTQYPMTSLEKLNILKMDFLGLRTLTVIDDAVKIIKRTRKIDIDLNAIPVDDVATLELLGKAQTSGVFQVESSGMRDILRKLKPSRFEDLIAVLALYRPGPIGSGMVDDFIKRKNGKEKFKYDHPILEPILAETYGIMVYQEQIMKVASSLAGFSLAQADSLRRAVSKKKPELTEQQKIPFVEGAAKNGVSTKLAERIFELIDYFSGYGFNKSHSAAYAVVSFQTAYLKAHYPVEFMTALLTSEKDNTDKIVQYIEEAKRMGIKVLPPDVNTSFPSFTVVGVDADAAIRFGLAAVKNVGQAAIDSVIQGRVKHGSFKSLHDFCERVDSRAVNRKTIESLIKVGAYDSLGIQRAQLMAGLDGAMAHAGEIQRDRERGQFSLFDAGNSGSSFKSAATDFPAVPEWGDAERLSYEKELLGFYVTGHPLDRYKQDLQKYAAGPLSELANFKNPKEFDEEGMTLSKDKAEILLGGLISGLRITVTKKNAEKMAIVTLEDMRGKIEVMVWPRVYAEFGALLKLEAIVFIKGRIEWEEDLPRMIASEVYTVQAIAGKMTRSVMIEFRPEAANDDNLHKVQSVLSQNVGPTPVYISFIDAAGSRNDMIIDRSLYVSPSQDFVTSVEKILGEGSVHLQV